jgi:CDP-diacylglycerol--glycerol-3-phosphate 3-phosphatidyltransferase
MKKSGILMTKDLTKISNLFSLLRIVLAIPIFIGVLNDEKLITTAMIFVAGFSDWADGYFARKRNEISELGKILDPLGDKLCLAALIIPMIITGYIPLWFAIIALGRDALILLGGLYIQRKKGFVIPSVLIGKITFVVLGFAVLGAYLRVPYFDLLGYPVATIFIIISFIVYLQRAIKILMISNLDDV